MDEAVDGLTEISQWATGFSATTNNVAWYITAAILTVALIPVVYAVASKSNNAKSYVLAWFVALMFALLFILR